MKMKIVRCLVILIFSVVIQDVYAQYTITGKVYDAQTKEGLPGVNIIIPNTTIGTTTGENSRFVLKHSQKIDSIIVSFTGYETIRMKVNGDDLVIKMRQSPIELNQVVITASRDKQSRKDAPVAMSILSPELIDETKPASMPELLNKVTSVHIADFGNEQQSMSIRQPLSFARTQLVVLEDGVPIGPTSIATSGDLKEINMAAVKSVEVVRGPTSSIYGSEAIGGAVNFLTQGPSIVPTAKISVQASDQGYKRIDYGVSNTFKKLGIFIGGYNASRRNGYRQNSDFDKMALTLRTDYHLSSKTKLNLMAIYSDFSADFACSLDSITFYTNDRFNYHTFAYADNNLFRVNARVDQYWNDKSSTFVTIFYRDNNSNDIPTYLIKRDYSKPFPPSYLGEYIESDYESYGFIVQHKQSFKLLNAKLITGLSVDYTPYNYTSEILKVTRNEEDVYTDYTETGSNIQNYNSTLFNSAAYMHLEVSPAEDLKVVGALRYDRLDYEFDNHLPPTSVSGAPDEKNYFSHLSPKIGLTYEVRKNIGVYVNYSVGFAPPLFSQLYKEVIVPVLKPATYYNYEVGGWMSFLKNKGYFDISLYQTDGVNEIVTVLLPDGSEQNQSVGKTLHKGIEYALKLNILKNIDIRFSGTNALHEFVEFIDVSRDYSGNEMTQAPQWIANAGITYKPRFIRGSRIGMEWQQIGEYYIDGLNSEKYQGYSIYHLRTGYRIKGFDVWVNVLNLFDELYACRVSKSYYGPKTVVKNYSPGVRRTILVGVAYNFTKGKK